MKGLSTSKPDLQLRKDVIKWHILNMAWYVAESWTVWKVSKCCAREGWRLVGAIARETKKNQVGEEYLTDNNKRVG
jgi:hypothetical protein